MKDFLKQRNIILAVIAFYTLLISGCSSISYTNIHQDIVITKDLSGKVSQTFTLNSNNYSLLFNQYSGDVLKGHAQDLAQGLGWSQYETETWNEGDSYYIKLTAKFANPRNLRQLLAQSGQELDLRATDGIFSKKFGFVSTARISQLKADTLTVSLTLPGTTAFSNGKTKSDGSIVWNLSRDSRLIAINASLVEYDAFIQLNFKTDQSGELITGVVAPTVNIEKAGAFYGGSDTAEAVGGYIARQTGVSEANISSKHSDKNTWVFVTQSFRDSAELSKYTSQLSLFKSFDFQKSGDNFELAFNLKAELFPYPQGIGNPNHMSFVAHMPGIVNYSNGVKADNDLLVWPVSASQVLTANATSSGRNIPAIHRLATLGLGGFSLVVGLLGIVMLFFSKKNQRGRLQWAGMGAIGLAALSGITLIGTLIFISDHPSRSISFLPTPGPSVALSFDSNTSSANGDSTNTTTSNNPCSDGYFDPSGQCWFDLDSASNSYTSTDQDNQTFDSGNSFATPDPYSGFVSTPDPFDYDGDGVGNMFDNDPNYYNPPGDFDYGQQDPLPFQDPQP